MASARQISIRFDPITRQLQVNWDSDKYQTRNTDRTAVQAHVNDKGEVTGINLRLPEDRRESLNVDITFPGQWYDTLHPNRGSWPRCILLTHGEPGEVANRLTKLIDKPELIQVVQPQDEDWPHWYPQGKPYWNQGTATWYGLSTKIHAGSLPELLAEHISDYAEIQRELLRWWLPEPSLHGKTNITPNFDLASAIRYGNRPGLLLVTAKAHCRELARDGDRCRSSNQANLEQILTAIAEANADLHQAIANISGGKQQNWELRHNQKYEMAARFAWAWKLTTMGIPTVLMYLGFLDADEVPLKTEDDHHFRSDQEWHRHVSQYCGWQGAQEPQCQYHQTYILGRANPMDNLVWEEELRGPKQRAPLLPIIRSKTVDFPLT